VSVTRETVLEALKEIQLPEGGDLSSSDMIKALTVNSGSVSFILEVAGDKGAAMAPVRDRAQAAIESIDGVQKVSVILTAHSDAGESAPQDPPPNLQIGAHPKPQKGPKEIPGVKHVISIASGKGGVGKSTVASNLAVALARQGQRVGLLDADIYGPSQHRMMGLNEKPQSPNGKTIVPLENHGVKFMSMGLLLEEDEAVVWRGPMLVGTLQQLVGQTEWGELDVLIVDLPPGTGDVQLSMSQNTVQTGAIVVSTPQDVALLDARKALNMFGKTRTPVLGMIENMSTHICSNCGHEEHVFGHGGAREEAAKLDLTFFGEIPLDMKIRLASDQGSPVALGNDALADAYGDIAEALIADVLT